MRRLLPPSVLLLAVTVVGCAPKADEASQPATGATASAPENAGGVTPMGSGATGGMTPVAGAENVGGDGGFAAGGVAKDRARSIAGAASGGGSLNQMGSEGGE